MTIKVPAESPKNRNVAKRRNGMRNTVWSRKKSVKKKFAKGLKTRKISS